jgi:ComF family protein
MTLAAILKPIGLAVLDTLLPPQCLACDTPVAHDGQFCLACFRRVNFISKPFCASCGVPFPFGETGGHSGICASCETAPPAFAKARAALRYDAASRHLILRFKYADRTDLAGDLALLMAKAGAGLLARADILVPVPLHISRLRQRRFNQSALLAQSLGRITGKRVTPDGLIRMRATVPLGPLGFDARRQEVQDVMRVRRPIFEGLSVLLIDDVMTSGATANACALALRGAGAARVDVLTAARVPDPRLT